MEKVPRPLPFSAFEWLLSGRYLRARRKEGFISVIAGFSFLGIMLGVATLIIVMAVMNGFRKELIDKIVGMNGHLVVQPIEFAADGLARRHRAHPSGSGHTACRSRGGRSGAGVVGAECLGRTRSRHSPRRSQQACLDRQQYPAGLAGSIRAGTRGRHRTQACRSIVAACRRQHHAGRAWRIRDVEGGDASYQALQGRGGVQHSTCRNMIP